MDAEPYVPLPGIDRDDWRDPSPPRCWECNTILDSGTLQISKHNHREFWVGRCPAHGLVHVKWILRSEN